MPASRCAMRLLLFCQAAEWALPQQPAPPVDRTIRYFGRFLYQID